MHHSLCGCMHHHHHHIGSKICATSVNFHQILKNSCLCNTESCGRIDRELKRIIDTVSMSYDPCIDLASREYVGFFFDSFVHVCDLRFSFIFYANHQ